MQEIESSFHPELWPFTSLSVQIGSNVPAVAGNKGEEYVKLPYGKDPLELAHHLLMGNRSHPAGCKCITFQFNYNNIHFWFFSSGYLPTESADKFTKIQISFVTRC